MSISQSMHNRHEPTHLLVNLHIIPCRNRGRLEYFASFWQVPMNYIVVTCRVCSMMVAYVQMFLLLRQTWKQKDISWTYKLT